jgi:hypothetical protein
LIREDALAVFKLGRIFARDRRRIPLRLAPPNSSIDLNTDLSL